MCPCCLKRAKTGPAGPAPVCMRRMVPGRIPTRVLVGGRLPGDHHHPWGIRIPLITADKDSRNVILPDPSSPPARSAARGTPQGQWQRPSSGVAVRVAVGAPTGSIGQLQIRAGGVSRGRVLVFPVSGVTLDVKGGETGCGTAVGAGALTQAQANKANMTNAATSRGTVSVFLSTGICRSLHETGNNYCLDYEIIRSYHKKVYILPLF